MKSDPYTSPQANLVPELRQRFRWKSAAAAATIGFLPIPIAVTVLSLGRRAAPPTFLFEPGFIGTLALISVLAASALERAKLWTWLYWLLTTVATIILFGGTIYILHTITRQLIVQAETASRLG